MLFRNVNDHLLAYKCRRDFAVASCHSLVCLASPSQLHGLHSASSEQQGIWEEVLVLHSANFNPVICLEGLRCITTARCAPWIRTQYIFELETGLPTIPTRHLVVCYMWRIGKIMYRYTGLQVYGDTTIQACIQHYNNTGLETYRASTIQACIQRYNNTGLETYIQ